MIFKAKPTLNIPKYINAIKTITSREIQRRFPEIKKKLWKGMFWSRSYFLATTGQVTLDVLKKYVESQGEKLCKQLINLGFIQVKSKRLSY